jgi:hypothetical protein
MIVLRPNGLYIEVYEKNPRLHYYNNTIYYYTLNTLATHVTQIYVPISS